METSMQLHYSGSWSPKDFLQRDFFLRGYFIFSLLLLLWFLLPAFIKVFDPGSAVIDPSIWLLLVLGLITFMVVAALNWWLLHGFWGSLGLPALGVMVLHFKSLELWQQLGFYWLSFALLLLVSSMCLIAIC
jgi:hypothetical protein